MRRCLELAKQERGQVGNGALVGSVLVRDGAVIAEGFHAKFGEPHAERNLLENFSGDVEADDVLFVNVEPCCHHGKTPPCTDIIIERGVKQVVVGMVDPDPRVRGEGIKKLRDAGISVTVPVSLVECERLNRGFIAVRTQGRPWVTLKSAQTRDGEIASTDGSPLKITTEKQDRWSHTWLRSTHDAILVGVQTVIADDPLLDARLDAEGGGRQPWKIILDAKLRIPLTARVVAARNAERTIVVHAPIVTKEEEDVCEELRKRGALLLEVPLHDGVFVWEELWHALTTSQGAFHGITSVLVEGGQRTWDAFRAAGYRDEEVLLYP